MPARSTLVAILTLWVGLLPPVLRAQDSAQIERMQQQLAEQMEAARARLEADLMEQERALRAEALATRYFDIVGDYAALGIPDAELAAEFDRVFVYVADRVGLPPGSIPGQDRPRLLVFVQPPANAGRGMSCPQRGAAAGRQIYLFADASTRRPQLTGVFAHEVGHVLLVLLLEQQGGFFGQMLNEGYATWAGGDYVTDWYEIESLQAAVAGQRASGRYLSVFEPIGDYYLPPSAAIAGPPSAEQCFDNRDRIYTAWGGFVEYLVGRDGHDALLSLLRNTGTNPGTGAPLSFTDIARQSAQPDADGRVIFRAPEPDYVAVYGLGPEALEAEWLASLEP